MANFTDNIQLSSKTVDKTEVAFSAHLPTEGNNVQTGCSGEGISMFELDPAFANVLVSSLHNVCLRMLDFHRAVQISGSLFFQIDETKVINIDICETVRKDEELFEPQSNGEPVRKDECPLKTLATYQTDAVKTPVPLSSHLVNSNLNKVSVPENPLKGKYPQITSRLTGAKRRKFKQSRKLAIHYLDEGEPVGNETSTNMFQTSKSVDDSEDTVDEGETTPSESDDQMFYKQESEGETTLPESDDERVYKRESPNDSKQPQKNSQKTMEKLNGKTQSSKKLAKNECIKSKQSKAFFKKKWKKRQVKKEYKCNQCSFKTTALKKLLAHQKASHGNGGLDCPDCGKTLSCSLALRRHHNSIHKGVRFSCSICQRDFSSQYSLNEHRRGAHDNEKPFKCKQCDMSFKFHHSLKLHILKHSGARPHKCPHCDKTYLTSSHLKEHVTVVHAETRNHCCSTCGKRFGYLQSLREHEKIHTSERPHTCSVCQKGFISLGALKTHEGTHVNSREFKCDECGKFYKTEILLKIHKRRHTQAVSRFMCDICGLRFMFKSNLKMHAAVHSDTKQFRCKTCGKTFKTYPTLYSHVQIHNPENTFSCTVCNKLFKTKARQNAHEKRHSEQKKHSCEECSKLFSSKGDLGKHKRTVHGCGSRFSCPLCGKVSARCDNIRGHLMRVHGKTSQDYSVEMLRLATGPNEEIFDQTSSAIITNLMVESVVPESLPNQTRSCGATNVIPLMSVSHNPHTTTGHPPEHPVTTANASVPQPFHTHLRPPQQLKEGGQQYMRDMLRTYDPLMPIQQAGTPNYGWSINH